MLLNEINTEFHIIKGDSAEVTKEHDFRHIQRVSRTPATTEVRIQYYDVFKRVCMQDKPIRTVLTRGTAGIGKTVSVHKFIVDWAKGKDNQDIHFIFPLPFRDLNLKQEIKLSLMDLLSQFFPDTKILRVTDYFSYKVMFIFDGLDECRLPLDFENNKVFCDITKPTSLDVLLTNLIKGNLLPSALIWITSRPAAASIIPPECVDRLTEIQGFSDPQKEEYFRKKISDQTLASRIITHIKSSKSLCIMSHIPVFCWISATVLERMLSEPETGEIPNTLTETYTHFLIFQTKQRNPKCDEHEGGPHWNKENILSLGKLAFQQLEKGNLIFSEEDLREHGIDVREGSLFSGVSTQIFREEFGLYQGKVYSFIHLSVQEFLAALFVLLSFINKDETDQLSSLFNTETMSDLLRSAVDKTLKNKNGHLDLFLQFLLGLSLESNQSLLQGLLMQTESSSQSKEELVKYIKEKIRKNRSLEQSINLFHCLNELNDHSLVEEVQKYVSGDCNHLSRVSLSSAQWSALVFVLLTTKETLNVFTLKKYGSEECLLKMLAVVKSSRKAELSDSKLTEKSCEALASVLSSNFSCLSELQLSNNNLQDSGVTLLSAGLMNPHCKVSILWLRTCNLTEKSCSTLASVLSSNSHLRLMDLSYNNLQDSGVKLLSTGLENPLCKLEKLGLNGCKLTGKSCATLVSVLIPNYSLMELTLSENNLQDTGVKLLSVGLEDPQSKMETLGLNRCNLTEKSCGALASVLRSNSSSLRLLHLTNNNLQDSGMKLLSAGLGDPHCKLETLWLWNNSITQEGFVALVSALRSNPSHLRELDLSESKPGDSGVKQLTALLKDPNCKLEKMMLYKCDITEKGCTVLASALSSNSFLRELNLNGNNLQDAGVKLLSAGLKNQHCKLKLLGLSGCNLTEKSGAALASVLSSDSSSLILLNLSNNSLQDSGVTLLSAGLEDAHCKLETLNLCNCSITEKGCSALASALQSNPSHLRELDMRQNKPGDSGVKLLSALLENPHCKLETLP
ncbi:NACHT, LRR and PYD domains-containing protein 3-like [Chanos chanos]|uniref:NACHT, LRR and PYD domains-containing protein 3-like n=1 Tax=Chanos chanos TaxID=29144 RepID=A0A6J2WRG2_CHACN|nr:NACHT, LRR and PYD domains-containing protein 3-like [Chanos chanos]